MTGVIDNFKMTMVTRLGQFSSRSGRQLQGLSADRINNRDPLAIPVATGPVTDEGGRRLLD